MSSWAEHCRVSTKLRAAVQGFGQPGFNRLHGLKFPQLPGFNCTLSSLKMYQSSRTHPRGRGMAAALCTAQIVLPLASIFGSYQVALCKSTSSTEHGSAEWKLGRCHLSTATRKGRAHTDGKAVLSPPSKPPSACFTHQLGDAPGHIHKSTQISKYFSLP